MSTTDNCYKLQLESIRYHGLPTAPRDQSTVELLAATTLWDMRYPVITIKERELDYNFMAAEAHWILSGERGITHSPPLFKNLAKYSDDGYNMSGAYGPPFIQQSRYVIDALESDIDTRQAVMTIWERSPRASKDIPCTISLQWLIRHDQLHCVATMRSSDAWLGLPYDIFAFTMMSAQIMLNLTYELTLGRLYIVAGSQHLYERNFAAAERVINTPLVNNGDILPMYLHGINTPDELRNILGILRNIPSDNILTNYQEMLCRSK